MAKTTGKRLHILALGSSYAAGPGIQPQVNKVASRSSKNYASLLATRLDAQLTDVTVSGATLRNVLSDPQMVCWMRFEPQLENVPEDTDIVTITAGGNDMGYIGGVMRSTLESCFLGRLITRLFGSKEATKSVSAEDVAELFIAIIDKIRASSPRCKIYLVEYLTLFGADTKAGVDVSFDDAKIKEFQEVAAELKNAYRLAGEARENCMVVNAAERSWNHGLGSEEPWVEGFGLGVIQRKQAPFHPNLNGMESVANMIYEEINKR